MDLRPNPPPSSVTSHETSVFSSPSAFATYCRVSLGDWVEVMIFTGRTLASTSAAGGSIGVWMKYGTKYSASITLSAEANASSTFPRSRMTWPPVRAAARSASSYVPESWATFGPSSHSIASFRRPSSTDQVLVPTTATPPIAWNSAGVSSDSAGISTTCSTPWTASASVASNDFTLPR